MTKSVDITQFHFYDEIPCTKENFYFLENLIEQSNNTLIKKNKILNVNTNKKIDRNNQIIRWFFFGLGVIRIEELMYLSEIDDAITTKPISIIITRFLQNITKPSRFLFEDKRKENMAIPFGEKSKGIKIYKTKEIAKQHNHTTLNRTIE